jgi:preprotein translocase subunit SecD
MVDLRENWRVIVLVVVLLGSTFAMFSPTLATAASSDGPTNLKYGLELAGGTRIRAPLVGVTAEDVSFGGASTAEVERQVAAQLGEDVTVTDVTARQPGSYQDVTQEVQTVEALTDNVTAAELRSALEGAGYWTESTSVRTGVTEVTRQQTAEILRSKINQAGLSGGTVQVVSNPGGSQFFMLVEVPNQDRSEVIDLVESRGQVRIDVYPVVDDNGSTVYRTEEAVLTQEDFQNIGTAQQSQQAGGGSFVPVTVKESVAPEFQETMVRTGVAGPGGSNCNTADYRNSTEPCLLVVVDGEVRNSFGMAPSLARDMRSGTWAQSPQFQLQTQNFSESREVAINLRAGALPARLNTSAGTSTFVLPSQGERFRTDSLITGVIAVFAVAGVVFLRYGEVRVAAPMVVTALSEVVILLGFAAAIGYPLDLSVIAGFIAVIGTGVDDLIIIADEVMAEGEVNSRRIFRSRFRKAFWVIGAAAATTIIAMSPLAVLSLGDLQGFAIFTILGVVAGVLLTRPAYGDILRSLLTVDR